MKQLPVTPTKAERLWSLGYLTLEYLLLPSVLVLLNSLLPKPLNNARLNLVFFLMNYLIVGLILRKFIGKSLIAARPGKILGCAALGLVLYWFMNLAAGSVILFIDPDFANVNDTAIAGMMDGDMLFAILGAVILVPPCEELLFRGVIFGSLYNKHPMAAYFVSSLCFSAIHVVGYIGLFSWETLALCFLQYIPAGIALGWAYARSGSILAPILIHTLVNALGVAILR